MIRYIDLDSPDRRKHFASQAKEEKGDGNQVRSGTKKNLSAVPDSPDCWYRRCLLLTDGRKCSVQG
jgi:hypothetical protein